VKRVKRKERKILVTKTFAKHIVNYNYDQIPQDALHEAKRSFLSWLGCAVGSHRHPAINSMLSVVELLQGKEQATFLGTTIKTDLQFAAILNGMSSNAYEFDDTFLDTIIHPSAQVFPSIVAWYEYYQLPCRDLLQHFVVGVETEERVGLFLTRKGHFEKGWHMTGTAGAFGSAAAIGRIIGLNEQQMVNALGIVATQPVGLREMFGTFTKTLHPGKAAANGMLAALLAKGGMTSSQQSLEAAKGFGALVSDSPNYDLLTEEWGNLQILRNSYKPFSCVILFHPAIDGAVRLYKQGIFIPDIKSVEIQIHPLAAVLSNRPEPKDQLDAIFSIQHNVAMGLMEGKASPWELATEKVLDGDVVALRNKIKTVTNSQLADDQAVVKVEMNDGRVVESIVDKTWGSSKYPLTDKDLEDKFKNFVSHYLTEQNQNKIIEKIWSLEKLSSISEIIDLCSPANNKK
jgi:2-methylcitrate dehydratase PrpD